MECFNLLPNELLLHVFSFLPLHSRKVASLVCKRWRDLARSVRLTSEDVFVIADFPNIGTSVLPNVGLNLRVKLERSSDWYGVQQRLFWMNHGARMKSLCIVCQNDDGCLYPVEVFEHCPNLQTLLVDFKAVGQGRHRCNLTNFARPRCSSKILHFGSNSSCEFLLRLVYEHAPNVQSVLFEPRNPSRKFDELALDFIKKNGCQLKKLKFSAISLCANEKEYFNKILGCLGPQLTELNVRSSIMLNDQGLSMIAGNLPNLKKIALHLCSFASDAGLVNFFSSLRKLTHISVTQTAGRCNIMKAMTDGVLPHLQSLHLYNFSCEKALHGDFITFFERHRLLIDFRIDTIECLTDKFFVKALCNVPSLRFLGLRLMVSLTEVSLREIFRVTRHLQSVTVTCCKEMLCHLPEINGLTSLRHLALPIENEKLLLDLKLPELRVLAVQMEFHQKTIQPHTVDPVYVSSLLRLFKNCPSLEYVLDMSGSLCFPWENDQFDAINRQLECVVVEVWGGEGSWGNYWNTLPVFTKC